MSSSSQIVTPTNSNLTSSAPCFRQRNIIVNSNRSTASNSFVPGVSIVNIVRQSFHVAQYKTVLLGTVHIAMAHIVVLMMVLLFPLER